MGNFIAYISAYTRPFNSKSSAGSRLGSPATPNDTPKVTPQTGEASYYDDDELYELNLTDDENDDNDEWLPFDNSYTSIVTLVSRLAKNKTTPPVHQATEYEIR